MASSSISQRSRVDGNGRPLVRRIAAAAAGADAQCDPATTDDVESGNHLSHQRRMSIGVGQRHGHGADALGLRQQRGQRCPAFQRVHGEQVEQAGRVVPEAVRFLPDAQEVLVGVPVLVNAYVEFDRRLVRSRGHSVAPKNVGANDHSPLRGEPM